MYNVTNPKTGKVYTFNRYNGERAALLASKLGVNVEVAQVQRFVCDCRRPRCQGCDDVFDARRDAGAFDRYYYQKRRRY